MTTLAPPNLYKMYDLIRPHLSSLRIGGIVGDTAHVQGGGYHISREDLLAHNQGGDYSIQAPADRRGRSYYAAAIDISLGPKQMVTVSKRLKAAMEGDNYDDRIEPLREFIGTVDNKNVCGYNRYQTGRRTGWYSSGYSDSSHLWHVHLSFFRDYCNNWNDILGVAEVVCGLAPGKLGWKNLSGKTAPKPTPTPAPDPAPKTQPPTDTKDWLEMATKKEVQDAFVAALRQELSGDGYPSPSLNPDSVKKNPKWTLHSMIYWLVKLVSLARRDMPTKKQINDLIAAVKEGNKS